MVKLPYDSQERIPINETLFPDSFPFLLLEFFCFFSLKIIFHPPANQSCPVSSPNVRTCRKNFEIHRIRENGEFHCWQKLRMSQWLIFISVRDWIMRLKESWVSFTLKCEEVARNVFERKNLDVDFSFQLNDFINVINFNKCHALKMI